jgi:Family of unknown function (DUF5329)
VQPNQRFIKTLLLIALGAASNVALAGLDAQGQREVTALLSFVGQSHCTFFRNGKAYDAVDAQKHLEFKLNYLLQRDDVNSAEQFIERAGSQSSFSGKPYMVNCGGNQRPTADWLKEELQQLRKAQP